MILWVLQFLRYLAQIIESCHRTQKQGKKKNKQIKLRSSLIWKRVRVHGVSNDQEIPTKNIHDIPKKNLLVRTATQWQIYSKTRRWFNICIESGVILRQCIHWPGITGWPWCDFGSWACAQQKCLCHKTHVDEGDRKWRQIETTWTFFLKRSITLVYPNLIFVSTLETLNMGWDEFCSGDHLGGLAMQFK